MSDDPQGLSLDDVIAAGGPPTPAPAPQPDPQPAPAPAPQPKPLSLDEVLSADQDQDRLAAATSRGLEQDPARAAKLIALQTRTGLPTDLIDRNYDAVLSAARRADFDPDAFRKQSPVVAQWLSEDPARVGLTRDDLPNLAAVEALVRTSPEYRYRPDGSIVETFPDSNLAAVYANPRDLRDELVRRGISLDDANARQKQVEDRLRAFGPLSGVAAGALLDLGQTLRAGHRLTGADDSAIVQGIGETAQASQAVDPGFSGDLQRGVGGLIGQAPLLMLGGPVAKAAQSLTKAAVVGRTLAPLLGDAGMALAEKAVTGAAVMQPLALRGAINDDHGTGHALGSWAIDSGIAGAFGPVGIGRAAAKAAGAEVAPFAASLSAAQVLLQHTGLGAGQNLAFDLAHRIHDEATGVDPAALDWHNLLPSLAVSGILGALPSAVFGTPEAIARAKEVHDRAGMPQIGRMAAALHGAETLRSIGDQVNDTQAMKLNQDATRGLLQKLAGDTPYRTLYVDAKAWQEHFDAQQPENPQAKPLSGARDLAAAATGDPLAFDKALSSNGHLAIPLDRFVPLLAETAHRDWLTGEARLAPEAMNEREAKEAATAATERAAIQAEAAGPDSPEAKRAASADLVHEDVKRQLMAAGVEESVADRNASLWRSVMHTAAERGWTPDLPHEAYARFKLRIQRGLAQPMVRSAVDALIERLKAGDIPTEADVERAKVRMDGQQERQATEDSARIAQIRTSLLDLLEHFRAVGADVQKETTEQLKQRLLAAGADRGEALAQGEPLEVHGRPVVVADVPYGGGTSADGRTVYIDRRIPRYLDVNGKRLDVHRMIAEHEVAEKARMDRGESYARAHDAATDIEHDAIDHQGISHAEYERLLRPYLDESKQAAAAAGIPADLEPKPYREMGEEHLIAGAAYEQPAYHGSPHKFDRFSLDKLGTGEGQQAFGHGLYFTGKKEIAEYYRNTLAPTKFTFDGKALTTKSAAKPKKGQPDFLPSIESAIRNSGTLDGAQQFLDKMGTPYPGSGKSTAEWREIANWFRDNRSQFEVQSKGRIYHVDIPEDGSYLRWDQPIRNESPKVRTAIEAVLREHPEARRLLDVSEPGSFQFKDVDHYMGEGLYRVLAQVLGSDAEASRVLAEHGVAGIDYPAGSMSGAVDDGTRNYVIFRGDDAKITHYEQNAGNGPRGTFLPQRLSAAGESLVTLLKGADRSTFLHETGHALLEFMHDLAARPDAPETVKADLAKIRDWLGADGDAPITRAQHEQFARGFEKYLMEGKAPSPALRGAFQRFKQWLKDIYRSLADLHVHLSDEVRAVFDRMLASDDEIASAQQETGAGTPVFADQAESGMNDQQWSAYLARVKEGTDRAREILEREAMAPLRAEATKQYQEARAKTRLAVADEVNQRPVYTAMLVLQKGAWPEGVEIPAGAERVKLDKGDLVSRLGDAGLKLLPGPAEDGAERPNRGRRLYSDDGTGVSADDAAELFGFRDGGDLVQALMSAPDRVAEIERVTDEKMREVHPDPLLDGTLHERARIAVDNDPRLEAMEREAAALAATTQRAATPSDLLRAVAKAQIAKTKAMDLRPSLYRVARDRAVRAGAEAMAKARTTTDPREKARLQGEALDHKTNEILQTHLYREASNAVEKVEKNRQYVRTWDKADKRERIGKAGGWEWTVELPSGQQGPPESFSADAYGGDPAKAQAAAQERARQMPGADVVRSGYLEQADAIREGIDLAPATNAAIGRREDLRSFIARKLAADEPINIPPEVVDALGARHWREMTVSEQQAVVDALRNLEHLAGVKNKLLAQGWKVTFDVAKAEQVAQMRATGRLRPDRGPSLMDNAVDIAGSYFSGMATVARYAREMDGGRDGGVMFEHWLRSVNEAEGRQLEMKERSTAEMARLVKGWGKLSTVAGSIPLSLRSHEPAIGRSMSHWERIMVALNWGNADNRARLLQGHAWSEAQAERVMAKLDGKDMRFVQGILDHIDSWWPEVKAKQERVFGVAPDKVEATPIVHGSGIYRGGYFPIAYDPRSMSRDITVDQQATLTRQGARLYASTARGHTEARTGMPPDAKLLLDPGVITRHLDNVVHDLAYHETLIDLNRFLRDPDVGATMRAYWGADVYRQFQTRLRDIAAGVQGTSTGIERLLEWTRQGVNFANRAFNIGSALQQAAGLPGSIVRVGPRYFAKALVGMFRNPYGADNAFRWVDEQSPMMRNRSKTFDKNVADAMQGISLRSPARKILDGAGYYFWTKAFQVLDTHTWLASYMKAMDEQAGDHGKAKAIADQTVADVQGSGATKDLPAAMRGGALAQVFTSNMSWWLANYNLTAEAVNRGVRGVRTGNLGDIVKSGSDLFVLYGVQVAAWSALSAALTGQKADQWKNVIDDPGTLAKSLAKDAAYTGLSSMVLLRDIADVAIEGRGYRGPAGLRSMSLVAAAVQAIRADQENASEVKAISKAAGPLLHLPVAQIVDTAEGIANAQEDGRSPLWAAMFGPARK